MKTLHYETLPSAQSKTTWSGEQVARFHIIATATQLESEHIRGHKGTLVKARQPAMDGSAGKVETGGFLMHMDGQPGKGFR